MFRQQIYALFNSPADVFAPELEMVSGGDGTYIPRNTIVVSQGSLHST